MPGATALVVATVLKTTRTTQGGEGEADVIDVEALDDVIVIDD